MTGKPLPQVVLGRTGLRGSAVGLGCSRFGSTLAGVSAAEVRSLVRYALDRGVSVFDTADIYGQGASERLLGAGLGQERSRVVLVGKAGQVFTARQRFAALFKGPIRAAAARVPALRSAVATRRAGRLPRDYGPGHVGRAIEGSLRRLGTDWLDVFLLHSPDAADVVEGSSFELLERLKERGTLRHWGVSCDDLPAAEAALRVPGVAVLQIPLLLAQDAPGLVTTAAAQGVALMVRELFASPPEGSGWRAGRVAAALALPNAVALVGTTRVAHLDEALASAVAVAP